MKKRRKPLDLEERIQIYNEVKRLRNAENSYGEIQRIIEEKYGVRLSKSVIGSWLRGEAHPLGRCNKIIEGPDLAYVIGAWLGDGRLAHIKSRHEFYVKLEVSDYDFAEEWGYRLAKALGKSKPYEPKWSESKQRWIVKGSSILLYQLLKKAKNDPRIVLPYLIEHPAEACRGFFDAEGGVCSNRYRIEAYNTDIRLIEMFKELLEIIGISANIREKPYTDKEFKSSSGKVYQRNKDVCYVLLIYGKENILRFAENVGFAIKRKRLELQKLIRKYNSLKIEKSRVEKCARVIIAANLVRLGLIKKQIAAAKMLSISRSRICEYLHNKVKLSRFLELPEIEQLSREYFYSRNDETVKKLQKILQAIIEMYGG